MRRSPCRLARTHKCGDGIVTMTRRASSSSDWVEVEGTDAEGEELVVELVRTAADAHRPAPGRPCAPFQRARSWAAEGASTRSCDAIFVIRDSYKQSLVAAASRMAATSVSFVICLIYLLFLPFHSWALAVLIGVSALTVTLLGRGQDAVTAAITTAVVLVVAAVSPHHAWQQPILRFVDTVIGVAVGIGAAWFDRRVIRARIEPPSSSNS